MGNQNVLWVRSEDAGMSGLDLTPHSMRLGPAVDLLEGGADIRTVQEVLRHASVITTMIYTRVSKKHLEEGYGKRKSLQGTASA